MMRTEMYRALRHNLNGNLYGNMVCLTSVGASSERGFILDFAPQKFGNSPWGHLSDDGSGC